MAIDFPSSPTNGQTFTSGSLVYTYDGTKWTAAPAGVSGGTKIEVGNTKAEILDTGSDGRFVVTTEGTERLRVDASGNVTVDTNTFYVDAVNNRVAIGTASPNGALEVASSSSPQLILNDPTSTGNGNKTVSINAARAGVGYHNLWINGFDIRFNTGGSEAERVRIDNSGRLLVGVSTAATGASSQYSLLQVVGGSSSQAQATINLCRNENSADISLNELIGEIYFCDKQAGEYAKIKVNCDGTAAGSGDYPGRIEFHTTPDSGSSPVERMRISSNGQTYWGSSAPGAASFGTSIGRLGLAGFVESYRDVNGTFASVQFGGNAGYMQVMGDGDLENTNNRYTGLSDLKLKQNIEDASSQWDDIKSIQVRKYELIANPDRKHIGCVAQELEQVCPGLVIEREDTNGESYKSVAYSVLYMKAVKALQEAMERIETLEAKVAALESA